MKLKPCPFCGGDAILREEGQSVEDSVRFFALINCKDNNCAIRVGLGKNQKIATADAIKNWNTRYEEKKETPEGAESQINYKPKSYFKQFGKWKPMWDLLDEYTSMFNLYDAENPDFAVASIRVDEDGNRFLVFEEADPDDDYGAWNRGDK